MSKIEVKELTTLSGESELTLGESGKTIAVPSGTTLDIKSGATIANNGTATGFAPTKSILQVKSLTYNTHETFSSGTATKSGFKESITRVNSDSDVLVIVNSNLYMKDGLQSFHRMFSYVYVDDAHFLDIGRVGANMSGGSDKWIHLYAGGSFLIPSASLIATSEISMWYNPDASNQPLQLNANGGASSMTLMEISV